ncbi:acyltransferase [Desulfobacterales bacterium HSG16]|nr:acyltransferase [Desulfobacterales bacterium HSG16]
MNSTNKIYNIMVNWCKIVYKLIANSVGCLAGWLKNTHLKLSMHYCGNNVMIYQPVVFYGPEALDIGDNTSVAPFVHIWCGGRVIIGARCMIASHVAITSLTHDYNEKEMWKTMLASPVVIEDDVWIGAHAQIMPGVTISRGSVIGAGSLVTKDIPPYAIVYGVPAQIKEYRCLVDTIKNCKEV